MVLKEWWFCGWLKHEHGGMTIRRSCKLRLAGWLKHERNARVSRGHQSVVNAIIANINPIPIIKFKMSSLVYAKSR